MPSVINAPSKALPRMPRRLAGLLEIENLVRPDIQQGELHAGRFQQARSRRTYIQQRTLPQRFAGPEGEEILLLGRQQVGTIDREERLANRDVLESGIHINLLHPSTNSRADIRDAG